MYMFMTRKTFMPKNSAINIVQVIILFIDYGYGLRGETKIFIIFSRLVMYVIVYLQYLVLCSLFLGRNWGRKKKSNFLWSVRTVGP